MSLQYSGFQGNLDEQTFEVYQITDSIASSADSMYYEFRNMGNNGVNLMDPNKATFAPAPEQDIVVGEDILSPQMRLYLDTNLARQFMADVSANPADFASNGAFLQYWKGFHVKTNNGAQGIGQGGVFYFNLLDAQSKLTVYYRELLDKDGVPTMVNQEYNFVMNSSCQDFNHVEKDYSNHFNSRKY